MLIMIVMLHVIRAQRTRNRLMMILMVWMLIVVSTQSRVNILLMILMLFMVPRTICSEKREWVDDDLHAVRNMRSENNE